MPQRVTAHITLPTSKSISNRALLLQALCPERRHTIAGLATCDDTHHMRQGIEAKKAGAPLIDIGATGTAMRFLTAYLAITDGETTLTGSRRMQQRPIATLVEALRTLGADITYTDKEGYPPLRIRGGKLGGGTLDIEAGISSQYISALLMIAPRLAQGLTLHLKGTVASRTYIDLTLDLMRRYGAAARWVDGHTIHVAPGEYHDTPLTVEADWSAASYWYELAAIAAHRGHDIDITLPGLTPHSHQGDRVVAGMMEPLGIKTLYTPEGARLTASPNPLPKRGLAGIADSVSSPNSPSVYRGGAHRAGALQAERVGVEGASGVIDFTHCPDIAQTMAVTCCLLGVPYTFTGIHSLRIKETDRVAALIAELHKLGYVLRAEGDRCLIWDGTRTQPQPHPTIDTYDDHRMAMAFAPAALCFKDLTIAHPEVVTKSYPTFWEDLRRIEN